MLNIKFYYSKIFVNNVYGKTFVNNAHNETRN